MITLQVLLGKELSGPQIRQCKFPFSKGGLGLRPLVSISHAAFVGAAAGIAPLWTSVLGEDWRNLCPLYVDSVMEAVTALRPKLNPRDFTDLFQPDDPNSFWDFFNSAEGLKLLQDAKSGLQWILTSLIEGKELDYFKGTLSPGDRSRLNSSSQKFASEWLRSSKSNTQLANSQFVTAILLRLGSPGESDSDPVLALYDNSVAPVLKDLRSKFLEEVIAMWALRAGAERAETQPKDLWLDDNKTPDIDIILGERQILVDVAVVHPTAPSYVVEARNPLGGSATMVLTKEDKYAELASSLGAEVVPAVIETFGALSDPLIGLFNDISKYAKTKPHLVWSQHEIYQGLVLDTSLVLQKWNAKIILEGARSR